MPNAVDPQQMHGELAPEEVPADAPPAASQYRPADIAGVSCASCVRFSTSDYSADVPSGICDLWESKVEGDHVCSFYTEGTPPMNDQGEYQWDFSDSEKSFAELHFAGTSQVEEEGFIVKEILRTGEWPVIPTSGGKLKRPLKIVRDGKSDPKAGIISLSEVIDNFKAGAIPNVQIPLSDTKDDHKNTTAVNTGYVRDIWLTGEGDETKLVAKMEFTEPDVKEKVLRGTYMDVSCGIPWAVSSRGKDYGSCLEHVAITNRPFIDGLGPFAALSDTDAEDIEVTHFSLNDGDEVVVEEEKEEKPVIFSELIASGNAALGTQLNLGSSYSVNNATFAASSSSGTFHITDATSQTSWQAPYQITTTGTGNVILGGIDSWTVVDEGEEDAPVDNSTAPRQSSDKDGLEAAQSLRAIRLSEPAITKKEATNMPLNREELDALALSDEQRAAFQAILDENVELSAQAREASADERVSELEEMGFKEKPGFLKFYREVMLSDDGGPAVVLLSDGEQKEKLTALEILDRALDTLSTDGKVNLSDQALISGNDDPPPNDASEEKTVEERAAEVKTALGLGN